MGGHDEQDKFVVRSQDGVGDLFQDVVARRMSRRDFFKSVSIASTVMIAGVALSEAETASAGPRNAPAFAKIAPTAPDFDDIVVAPVYFARTLIRWGEPLFADSPEFDVWNQSADSQSKQFGYNCDFVG